MENPTPPYLLAPGKVAFCVHVFFCVSYSQKSFMLCCMPCELTNPVPTYPLLPIEKATDDILSSAGNFSTCSHMSFCGSYCQKSFLKSELSVPNPAYPLSLTVNAAAFSTI